ncbi:MAG: cytochrome c3 family protein [Gillisia sp.]
MKKVKFRHSTTRLLILSALFLFSFSDFAYSQESDIAPDDVQPQEEAATAPGSDLGDPVNGKTLFNSLCAACHKPYAKGIGPALHGVTEKYSRDWLNTWIRNSLAMVNSGDAQAVAIYEEYNKTAMPAFPALTDAEIGDLLAYVELPKPAPPVAAGPAAAGEAGPGVGGVSNNIILGILAFVLLMLLLILFLVNRTLRKFAVASGVELPAKKVGGTPIWKAFVQNQFLVLVTSVIVLLAAGYFVYGFFMQVGIDQGYQPIQPIHYSHKIHAGDNQIDCNFCHSSASVSKHSGIPSLNVCMNCHVSIGEVAPETATEEYSKEFYDNEIAKLYDAVGWDPESQSYTGETKPVKWVRIHNLPDFAYFNHSQHVTVAGIACQTCHGPIEEMEIVYQSAPLTMGWCINCHRETNVNMEGNEYYEKIHEELSNKYGVEELTAAQLGGLECAKCHY